MNSSNGHSSTSNQKIKVKVTSIVAKKYSRALFNELKKSLPIENQQKWEAYISGIADFSKLIEDNPQLKLVFSMPQVTSVERTKLVSELCGKVSFGKLDSDESQVDSAAEETVSGFLKLLADSNRMTSLSEIVYDLEKLYKSEVEVKDVEIITAFELDEQERSELIGTLEGSLKRKVNVQWAQNQDLLGGMQIKIDDSILDNSLIGKLESVKRQMLL